MHALVIMLDEDCSFFEAVFHVRRLLVDVHHLGQAIAPIGTVCHGLCVGHDKVARPFSWMPRWLNADPSPDR